MKKIFYVSFLIFFSCKKDFNKQEVNPVNKKVDSINSNLKKDSINSKIRTISIDDSKAIEFLYSFYKEYIFQLEANTPNNVGLEKLLQQFCTPDLITNLKNSELDYDRFLNAQDTDQNILKTLKISKDNKNNFYLVSYIDSYTKKDINIKLKIIEEERGVYKINKIF